MVQKQKTRADTDVCLYLMRQLVDDGMRQVDIAEILGITQGSVSYISIHVLPRYIEAQRRIVNVSDMDSYCGKHDTSKICEAIELQGHMIKAFTALRPREEKMIRLYYGIDGDTHTFSEVAEHDGCTRERARQIIVRALEKLRRLNNLLIFSI